MKKSILFIVTIMFSLAHGKVICLHYDSGVTLNTCMLIKSIVGKENFADYKVKDYKDVIYDMNDIVYIAGYSEYDGKFWLDANKNSTMNICKWLEIPVKVIFIDSCYSGKIFQCRDWDKYKEIIITSTNAESLSTNISFNNTFVSSLSVMLYCMTTNNCKDIFWCSRPHFDPQICQLYFIVNKDLNSVLWILYNYPDLHRNVSIGTVMINGKPWRMK